MPGTFGAGTDSVISFGATSPTTLALSGRALLSMGWYYPTTLTAGRYLCAAGGTHGLTIDSTTTDIRIVSDYATTDGQYTAPAGLVINTWNFVAWLSCYGATTVIAHRLFVGNGPRGVPTERTVTQAVAPVGALSSGGTTWYQGNNSAGALAFQGDQQFVSVFDDANGTELNAMGIAAAGAIDDSQATAILQRIVIPIWRGNYMDVLAPGHVVRRLSAQLGFLYMASFDHIDNGVFYLASDGGRPQKGTSTNVAASTQVGPRFFDDAGLIQIAAPSVRMVGAYAANRG